MIIFYDGSNFCRCRQLFFYCYIYCFYCYEYNMIINFVANWFGSYLNSIVLCWWTRQRLLSLLILQFWQFKREIILSILFIKNTITHNNVHQTQTSKEQQIYVYCKRKTMFVITLRIWFEEIIVKRSWCYICVLSK